MKPRSIGVRLTLRYAATFACALVLIGAGLLFTVRQSLYHAIDDSLRDRVEGIGLFIEEHRTRLQLEEVKAEFRAHGDYFRVTDQDGSLGLPNAEHAGRGGSPERAARSPDSATRPRLRGRRSGSSRGAW